MERALIDTDIWFDILRGVRPRVLEYADAYWCFIRSRECNKTTLKVS